MNTVFGISIALLLALGVAGAWAEEIRGRIRSTDPTDRAVMLENGTRLWLTEGVPMAPAERSVVAVYEEREGKKVATTLQAAEMP